MFKAIEMPVEFLGSKHTDIVTERSSDLMQHAHDYFELNFITSGRTRMKLNERVINYDSYDFLLIPPQMRHVLYWSEYDKYDNFVIWFRSREQMLDLTHALKLHDYDGAVQHLCAEIFRLYTQSGMAQKDIINAYLYTVLLHLRRGLVMNTERAGEKEENRIENAIKIINTSVLKRRLTVGGIAAEVGYSPAHFTREFRRRIGVSPVQYLIGVRVAQAKRMLTETDASVQEIAALLFYDDPLYFSRQFARAAGIPPTRYRELYGDEAHIS